MINQTNTCVQDPYSTELFCTCETGDLCNRDNTGNKATFGLLF